MTTRRALLAVILLALLGLAAGLLAFPRLPAQVPSHWNAAGQVDGTTPRETAVYMLPGMLLAFCLLILYLPNIDPLRANVERFRAVYNWCVLGLALFFLFLHGLVLLAGLGVRFNINRLIVPAAGLLLAGAGLLIERTQPNWFIGIRTPWTLSSPAVWAKTHRLGGRLFKLSGAACLLGAVLPPEAGLLLLITLILLVTLATTVYSYLAYRKERRQHNSG